MLNSSLKATELKRIFSLVSKICTELDSWKKITTQLNEMITLFIKHTNSITHKLRKNLRILSSIVAKLNTLHEKTNSIEGLCAIILRTITIKIPLLAPLDYSASSIHQRASLFGHNDPILSISGVNAKDFWHLFPLMGIFIYGTSEHFKIFP